MSRDFPTAEKEIPILKSQWDELASDYTSNQAIKDDVFQVLQAKYSEEHRFYHNLGHVKTLLTLCDSLESNIQDHNAIKFSIWFHDIVYDTKRNDNEEESARVASEMLVKVGVHIETMEFVQDLILATKDHHGRNLSSDAKLFLDLDLAILGSSAEIYQDYSKSIRAEYSWVAEPVYGKGRKEVLMGFLERENIYFTDEMKSRFEEQARKNMRGEIKALNV